VRCAVTGESIRWTSSNTGASPGKEPYVSAAASLRREIETHPELRSRR